MYIIFRLCVISVATIRTKKATKKINRRSLQTIIAYSYSKITSSSSSNPAQFLKTCDQLSLKTARSKKQFHYFLIFLFLFCWTFVSLIKCVFTLIHNRPIHRLRSVTSSEYRGIRGFGMLLQMKGNHIPCQYVFWTCAENDFLKF